MIGAAKLGLTLEREPWTRLSWRKDTYSAPSAPSSKPPTSFLLALKLSCGTRWYGGAIGAGGACRGWKRCTPASRGEPPSASAPGEVGEGARCRVPTQTCRTPGATAAQ